MNRSTTLLLGLVACAAMAVGAGCGDDTSDSGGSGGAGGGDGGSPTTGGGNEGGSGAGTPGNTCESYCSTMADGCTGNLAQYADQTTCERECEVFTQGEANAMSGNSLECRAYHAGVAAGGTDPEIHCVHAGPLGGGPIALDGCGTDRCESFCLVAEEICSGEAAYPFDNFDDCKQDCLGAEDATKDFNINETSGTTLACRMYHLSVAATGGDNQALHCGHVDGSQCL